MSDLRLVAIDLDETLLDSSLAVDDETINYLSDLQKRGIKLVIATGRTWPGAQKVLARLGFWQSVICYNGGLVYAADNGVLLDQRIDLGLAKELIRYFRDNNLFFKTYVDDIMYVPWLNKETKEFINNHGVYCAVEAELDQWLQVAPNMLVLIEDENTCDRQQDYISNRWLGKIKVTRSHRRSLEFLPPRVSKGMTLARIAAKLGFGSENCMAIGNEMNDLEMLQWASVGVAVANSPRELQESADFITAANNEQGVLKALRLFLAR